MVARALQVMVSLLCGPLLAQQTWKVNCSGDYGAHFTDLPAAVAAAAPGDSILVYGVVGGGCGAYYNATTIDKPLHVSGFVVGQQPGNSVPTYIPLRGTMHITGITAGQQVTLSNIVMQHVNLPPPFTSSYSSSILITDCDGSVLLEDATFDNLGTAGQDVRIERSDHVVIRGCDFYLGGDPLRIVDSTVLMTNTLVQYDPPYPPPPLWPWPVGYTTFTESTFLQRSQLTMVASLVRAIGGQPPQNAVVMDTSTLRIGASTFIQGGLGPNAQSPPWPTDFAPAYRFVGTGPSVVYQDPRAPILFGPPTPPPVPAAVHETFHDWIVADEYYQVRVMGPVGGFAGLMVGDMIAPVTTPLGLLGIDPGTAQIVHLAQLSSTNGFFGWTFFCPPTVPNGYAFCLQSLVLSPTGELGLTEPSPLTVAWDKTRIP
jgi:hypothetical protein